MTDVHTLLPNDSTYVDELENNTEMLSTIKGIDTFARLTNKSCFIIDFEKHKMIYRTEHLRYVDLNSELQRECYNPYWSLVSEDTHENLLNIKKHYPTDRIDLCEFKNHICSIDFPVILHKREFYINQKFTPLMMGNDGMTKFGLFVINPSTFKHMQCFIYTKSKKCWKYNIKSNEFVIYDKWQKLSDMERMVLFLVQKGMRIEEIACNLNVSISTIKTYRVRLFKKLDVKTMPEALTVAGNFDLI